MAWRSQMGRVLVGRSLVGRLWHRSLLGIYTSWLGLELSLSVSEAASRTENLNPDIVVMQSAKDRL
jgi:hypothetical protein